MADLMKIHASDDVAVALSALSAGTAVDGLRILDDIPFGHKVALQDIPAGTDIVKYASPIARAARDIRAGEHVHSHNARTRLSGKETYEYRPAARALAAAKPAFFDGYERADGAVGVRNEVWIVPTVGCVNDVARAAAAEANRLFAGRMDGVFALTHDMGCSQLGDDLISTQRLLAGLVRHPNAAGVLVLSLGCENNHLEAFLPALGDYDPERVKFLVCQDVSDEFEAAVAILSELCARAETARRTSVPASKLVVGMKCGGSDAFSGITANPLCGRVSDRLAAMGGAAILTEVPEMFGAEALLMARAADEFVFSDIGRIIDGFKDYFVRHGEPISENPSPGNRAGGITTLEEKSLGCVQKGGRTPVVRVLGFGERALPGGLNLLNGPGNDPISCTNLVASGAQIILFTTGRGNPFGAPVPTVKISSNTQLARKKSNWIDFDAGRALDAGLDALSDELCSYVLDVASGRLRTKNELRCFREIALFRDGVIL